MLKNTSEPEIDAEWMKFMSRITRQQNCDTVDADNDSSNDDDDDDEGNNDCDAGRRRRRPLYIKIQRPPNTPPV